MNPVEAVVTFTYKYTGNFGAEYFIDDYGYHVVDFFLEIFELLCNEEDAGDLEELRRIYQLRWQERKDALQEFLVLDRGDNMIREFSGFKYALDTHYHLFSFCAVGRMPIKDLLAKCAKMGMSIEDLHSRDEYDVAIRINDPELLDKINDLIGDPKELLLPRSSCEIKFGATEKFDEYSSISGREGFYSPSKHDVDTCDKETLWFIREDREPFPQDMVFVKGGDFFMGRRNDLSEFRHQVQLSDFHISRYPVTFEQYDQFCTETGREKPYDEGWGRSNLPVINVSYAGAKDYCLWMTKKTGIRTDLPTEAQWEFAARGGTLSKGYRYAGSNDFDEVGWLYRMENDTNFPVGLKKPNELGIHDMSGNTWEWCRDIFRDHFYRMSPLADPMCNTIDINDFNINRRYGINDFFKASLERSESDLESAFNAWLTRTKEQYLKEDAFDMVIRGGCAVASSDEPPLFTQRGQMNFMAKNRKVGFRIVMYP